MRIGLFVSCVVDTLAPEVGRATVEVLERQGHEVVFPEGQTCCGQMHSNSGYPAHATRLARNFVSVFADGGLDAIVSPSSSCVCMVREQYPKLARAAGDERMARGVDELVPKLYELSMFLVGLLGVEDVGATFPHRVVYHPTCHGLRGLQVGDAPLRLLRKVRGIELVELPEATACCGFGGTFAVKNADVSAAMGADKVRSILATEAEVCTAGDSSCLLQIGGALSRARTGVRAMHLAEILASRA